MAHTSVTMSVTSLVLLGGRLLLKGTDVVKFSLKEEVHLPPVRLLLSFRKNGDSLKGFTEGMIGISSYLGAILTLVSVALLSMPFLLCLKCKRKSKIIHEENQIYNPQTFQRGGSRFAVMQSKTVTSPNQITRCLPLPPTLADAPVEPTQISEDVNDYQNVTDAQKEPTYVAPLPILVYENIEIAENKNDTDPNPSDYGNIFTSSSINNDDDDYENSDFLDQVLKQQDEPDYVNADDS